MFIAPSEMKAIKGDSTPDSIIMPFSPSQTIPYLMLKWLGLNRQRHAFLTEMNPKILLLSLPISRQTI